MRRGRTRRISRSINVCMPRIAKADPDLATPPRAASGCARSGSIRPRPSATGRRRRARRSSISATCRSTRSTSSSARTTTSSTRASRPTGARTSTRRRRSTRASSNTGRTRSPTSRRATFASSCARCAASAQEPHRWFGSVAQADLPKGARAHPPRRRAHHPRHRRRRAGREGASLGEPQAVEARAAARLLSRRRHDQRAHRHAEDLRADRPAFRLGDAARARDGARVSTTTCSTARCARRASSASIPSATSTRRASPRCES